MKDASWIFAELDHRDGPFASFEYLVELCMHPLRDGVSLGKQVENAAIGSLALREAIARLVANEVGLWYFGGWIDQAVFHVSRITKGGARLGEVFFQLPDNNAVDQNGDMVVGFASLESNWALVIQISVEKRFIEAECRAADEVTMNSLEARLHRLQ